MSQVVSKLYSCDTQIAPSISCTIKVTCNAFEDLRILLSPKTQMSLRGFVPTAAHCWCIFSRHDKSGSGYKLGTRDPNEMYTTLTAVHTFNVECFSQETTNIKPAPITRPHQIYHEILLPQMQLNLHNQMLFFCPLLSCHT